VLINGYKSQKMNLISNSYYVFLEMNRTTLEKRDWSLEDEWLNSNLMQNNSSPTPEPESGLRKPKSNSTEMHLDRWPEPDTSWTWMCRTTTDSSCVWRHWGWAEHERQISNVI